MPKDATDTRAVQPGDAGEPRASPTAKGADRPAAAPAASTGRSREEDVNVDLGNQFTPADPAAAVHRRRPRHRPVDAGHRAAPTSASPARTRRCATSGWSCCSNGQNANADFNLMTNFRTDPNGDGRRATPGPATSRSPAGSSAWSSTTSTSSATRSRPWYGEPRPIGGIPVGIYARVDTVPERQPAVRRRQLAAAHDRRRPARTARTRRCCRRPRRSTARSRRDRARACTWSRSTTRARRRTRTPNYNPNLLTATTPCGRLAGPDRPARHAARPDLRDRLRGPGGRRPGPELLQVSTPVRAAPATPAPPGGSRSRATSSAPPAPRPAPPACRATLTDARTGAVTTLTRANGGIVELDPGQRQHAGHDRHPASRRSSAARVPARARSSSTIITANANGGVSQRQRHHHARAGPTAPARTRHLQPAGRQRRRRRRPADATRTRSRTRSTARAAGSLLVLSPGTYNENVARLEAAEDPGPRPGRHHRRARAPGPRPGGPAVPRPRHRSSTAASSSRTPTALRRHRRGARRRTPASTRRTRCCAAPTSPSSPRPPRRTTSRSRRRPASFGAARIDGLGLHDRARRGRRRHPAAGVRQQHAAHQQRAREQRRRLRRRHRRRPAVRARASHNYNVRIANDRLIGNGGLTQAGGLGIFYGSNNYEVANSIVCSNFSVEYGAGISHSGSAPAARSTTTRSTTTRRSTPAAGIAIETRAAGRRRRSATAPGTVDVDRNLIQSNYSGDDGGGIFVLDALDAADQHPQQHDRRQRRGRPRRRDHARRLVERARSSTTRSRTTSSTGSSENSRSACRTRAGLASEANDPLFQATPAAPSAPPDFSNPVALFNNIFWNNDAFTLSQFGPGRDAGRPGVHRLRDPRHDATTPTRFTPRYSRPDQRPDPRAGRRAARRCRAARATSIGADPLFVDAVHHCELTVSGSRLDPQTAAVTITGAGPAGRADRRLPPRQPAVAGAIDRGVRCSNTPVPPPANAAAPARDRRDRRPRATGDAAATSTASSGRSCGRCGCRTPWDLGADELPAYRCRCQTRRTDDATPRSECARRPAPRGIRGGGDGRPGGPAAGPS